MAYNAQKHDKFSDRMTLLFHAIQSVLDEGEKLDQIYLNETGPGTDPAWVDTENATADQHVDGITFYRALRDFVDGSAQPPQSDRRSNISAFTQLPS